MIHVPTALLREIAGAAEAAYPDECCGLLVGRRDAGGDVRVTRVAASGNETRGDAGDSFEVSPKLRFDLMRELDDGPEDIVGSYHSHPDMPAKPSERDLDMAYEPAMVWLITSVEDGRATDTTAHLMNRETRTVVEVPVRTNGPAPAKGPAPGKGPAPAKGNEGRNTE